MRSTILAILVHCGLFLSLFVYVSVKLFSFLLSLSYLSLVFLLFRECMKRVDLPLYCTLFAFIPYQVLIALYSTFRAAPRSLQNLFRMAVILFPSLAFFPIAACLFPTCTPTFCKGAYPSGRRRQRRGGG